MCRARVRRPATNQFQPGDFRAQAERTFRTWSHCKLALAAECGQVNVYLVNVLYFAEMTNVYRQFADPPLLGVHNRASRVGGADVI